MSNKIVVVLGPTASGKTRLACQLAQQHQAVIISADSRQVYQELNLGVGKDYQDYIIEGNTIPYEMIDIVSLHTQYHIAAYQDTVAEKIAFHQSNNKNIIVCGGSGLYLDAIIQPMPFAKVPINEALRTSFDNIKLPFLIQHFHSLPKSIQLTKVDFNSKKRVIRAIEIASYLEQNQLIETKLDINDFIFLGLRPEIEWLHASIKNRLNARLESGMIDEVNELMKAGFSVERLRFLGLEYEWITRYLIGEISLNEMKDRLFIAIRQFAKRQLTWFKRMEKQGFHIHWIELPCTFDEQLHICNDILYHEKFSNF
jgi:tRNA dimethylallyltransferase